MKRETKEILGTCIYFNLRVTETIQNDVTNLRETCKTFKRAKFLSGPETPGFKWEAIPHPGTTQLLLWCFNNTAHVLFTLRGHITIWQQWSCKGLLNLWIVGAALWLCVSLQRKGYSAGMIYTNKDGYAPHHTGPLSFKFMWFSKMPVNAGV